MENGNRMIMYRDWTPKAKMIVMMLLSFSFVMVGFLSEPTFGGAWNNLWQVASHQNMLIVDYFYVGSLSGAFLNVGLLGVITTLVFWINKQPFNGLNIAIIFTVKGFALIGKNLINIWPILLGVYLYSKYKKEPYSKHVNAAFLATAMSPVVTEVMFHTPFSPVTRVVLSILIGIVIGFIVPPMGGHFSSPCGGNNLYNIGFTAGMVVMLVAAVFRAFGYVHTPMLLVSTEYHAFLAIYVLVMSIVLIILGILSDKTAVAYLMRLWQRPGTLVTDFVDLDGFSAVVLNMGITGVFCVLYVFVVGGQLNGAVVSGIFTVMGFSAAGNHLKNIIPIMVGVALGTIFKLWDINATPILMVSLFGTALSPIAGKFGFLAGVVAGFLHLSLVNQTGSFHAGMNLYNNGFSAGLLALIMTPILVSLVKPRKLPASLDDKYITRTV